VLLECNEVDAVTIASPISFHYEQVRQALLSGKHVHCNKAMATTVREAEELIKLARERNVRIVPHQAKGFGHTTNTSKKLFRADWLKPIFDTAKM
jgi:scyllo-inositol 2-dehydrogenase (NADP+)